jgi:type VI protein secretion system component VasK
VKPGNVWTQKPDAQVKLSTTFLNFFNRASAISETLFQGGSLSMRYKLAVKSNPAIKQITGTFEGGQFSMGEKEYAWLPSNSKIDLRVVQSEGSSAPLRGYSGPWAIFRLLSGADKVAGRDFQLIYVLGGGGNQQSILPDGTPIMLSVGPFPNDINPFDPTFFQFTCPGRATE